jgi:HPt (histidine-containing phosphotransfer) domain-containing protein
MKGGRYAHMPIIALTANAVVGTQEMFLQAGMNDFISKPIDEGRINLILTRWLPEEKIDFSDDEARRTHRDEEGLSRIFYELSRISELDVTLGLFHVGGSKSVYVTILKQFCNEIVNYLQEIKHYMDISNSQDFKIRIHAVRGMLSNIGMVDLSEWAHQLEVSELSLSDSESIRNIMAFCEEVSKFCKKLLDTGIIAEHVLIEKQSGTREELHDLLHELKNACMHGESDKAEEIGAQLSAKAFGKEADALIAEIDSLIASYDYDVVLEKIKEMPM